MVRLIMGAKGSGKTKRLIEMINNAAKDEPGNVVCIEANRNMTYDIHYHIRLIDAEEYKLTNYDSFRGFISGLYAGNYDISHVFIDSLCRIIGRDVDQETEDFLGRVYHGSLCLMVSAMTQKQALSREELGQLYELLKGLEGERHA